MTNMTKLDAQVKKRKFDTRYAPHGRRAVEFQQSCLWLSEENQKLMPATTRVASMASIDRTARVRRAAWPAAMCTVSTEAPANIHH